ncbi:unnamed protein product [Linum tenue]|uniref:Ninja-family protein n=1 Tax=Linum tenue TaxID=586396 RepID=A0AAV0NWU5_9ROSI|nr:unnamed protein product [Linum tenue]
MGEAEGAVNRTSVGSSSSSRAMESLSLEINRYPRDLLTRFMSSEGHGGRKRRALTREEEEEDEAEREAEEIELNLGLSLGGRFGVDKTSKKITRSSSIAGSIPFLQEPDAFSSPPAATSYPLLMRASSLPTETEEEWRKRKEMQSLRRMEAKRRRSEKQRNLTTNLNSNPSLRGLVGGGSGGELSFLEEEKKELLVNVSSNGNSRGNWMANWGSCRQGGVNLNGSSSSNHLQVGSQVSVESQGGNSSTSGMSEMESKPNLQGSGSAGSESRSPMSNQSLQDQRNQAGCSSAPKLTTQKSSRAAVADHAENNQMSLTASSAGDKRGREAGTTSAMEDMPCVFTIGDGPNGRRVEGILYKYGRGEEVRIMCVCHGSFLSPAEFVKHAGGINVDHPLRHIVVNPAGPSFC